jgi:hypothetical protein
MEPSRELVHAIVATLLAGGAAVSSTYLTRRNRDVPNVLATAFISGLVGFTIFVYCIRNTERTDTDLLLYVGMASVAGAFARTIFEFTYARLDGFLTYVVSFTLRRLGIDERRKDDQPSDTDGEDSSGTHGGDSVRDISGDDKDNAED